MKKLLFSLSLIGALAASADDGIDASAQVFGVLPITTPETNVIVAVPWVAASNTDTNKISVAEIIKTANLTENDEVRVWDDVGKVFKVWTLTGGQWVPGDTVTAKGVVSGSNAGDVALQRGDALVLHRQNPKDGDGNANTFYVYGQYVKTAPETITCAKATYDCPKAFTLIAPPVTSNTFVNAYVFENVGPNDYITIAAGRVNYNADAAEGQKWGSLRLSSGTGLNREWKWSPYTQPIPAGQGFWYTSTNTNDTPGAVRVSWPAN